ncbi:gp4a [Lomovskayavirus C31]|uniref:Gp4a n=1 Tax=Streptomyces phage phiC31 TaxID=10719 RepID=Q9ZX95_BPPHC|nr:gp4a [Lomovskayavirus C31]CAA07128.1 gp4a [Lomovskayavirus C31]
MAALDPASPEAWAHTMRTASDDAVKAPLWQYPPEARRAVLSERARRFGIPTADDFDPEYH